MDKTDWFPSFFRQLIDRCELPPDGAAALLERILRALSGSKKQKDSP